MKHAKEKVVIGSAVTSQVTLLFCILVIIPILELLAYLWISKNFDISINWYIFCMIYIAIFAISIPSIQVSPSLYEGYTLVNLFNRKVRGVIVGINWKLWWESVDAEIDGVTEVSSHVTATIPTTTTPLVATFLLTSKADLGRPEDDERTRSEKMVTYASFDEEAIRQSQESLALKTLTDAFGKDSAEEIKKKPLEEFLKPNHFEEFETEHGLDMVDIIMEDLDYQKEAQEAMNAKSMAKALAAAITILRDEAKMSQAEAERQAPLMIKDMKLERQVYEVEFKGVNIPKLPRAATAALVALAKKLTK